MRSLAAKVVSVFVRRPQATARIVCLHKTDSGWLPLLISAEAVTGLPTSLKLLFSLLPTDTTLLFNIHLNISNIFDMQILAVF